ncbi:MAG TPA: ribosome assembly RNA-binding protein YhbY [Thermoclostridium sp.]|nr:ribosome assembly RNA-binding protein YhbY [Clostridiaceae bacterium]HOQ75190.1 ribosome assembly RNA-binding protein YhbY [Thermoclostridium sp.]HPU44709.1 ribosome assembly RNA-binding protein YhbY [Thermoclostridium sp.]
MTGKQRSYLRSLANSIPAIFQVGKNGLEPNSIRQFDEALEARELVKASVMRNSPLTAREAADTLAGELGAEVIQVLGNRFVLYRESKKNKVIQLP